MKSLQNISYKTLFTILFLSLAGIVFFIRIGKPAQKVSAAWWDEMWHYRKAVSIENSSGTNLTDFQVSISIGTSALIASGKMQSDCDDIRITDINGNLLPYWIETSTCNTSTTNIISKIDSLPTTGSTVYIYYGNSTAESKTRASVVPQTCSNINAFLGSGVYYVNPTGTDTSTPVQAYCDMTTDGGGWTLVASWNTAQEWTKAANSSSVVFDTTAKNTVSSNFGNAPINDFRVLASDTITSVGTSAYADWYYHYNTATTWKEVWAPSSNTGGNIDSTYRSTSPRQAIKPFNYSYNLKFSYQVTQTWNNLSDWSLNTSSFGLPNYWLALTSPGNQFGVYGAVSGSGSNDGSLGICPSGSSNCITGQDMSTNNCKIGYDDNIPSASFGATATSSVGANPPVDVTTKLWWFIRNGTPTSTSYSIGTIQSEETGGGPVAYWKFDEGNGTTAYDSTSNQNNGTISGATWSDESQCISGKCLSFDGNDYLGLTDTQNSSLDIKNQITMSVWVRPTSSSNLYYLISKNSSGGYSDQQFSIAIDADNNQVNAYVNGTGVSHSFNNYDTWSFISATWDGSYLRLYQNGKLLSTASYSGTLTFKANFSIGRRSNSTDGTSSAYTFYGYLDDVKIYPYARTADQIKQDYNSRGSMSGSSVNLGVQSNTAPSLKSSLIAHYKFDEGDGTSVYDSSGNDLIGTFGTGSSAPTWTKNGKSNSALNFDGIDDAVSTPNTNYPSLWSDPFSISTWIYIPSTATWNTSRVSNIISRGDYNGSHGLVTDTTNNRVGMWARDLDNTGSTQIRSVYGNITRDKWYHIIGSWDGTKVQLYINGVFISQNTGVGFSGNPASTTWKIGSAKSFSGSAGTPFTGLIDEVKIYNRALTAEEVKQDYNQGSAISFGSTTQTIGGTTTSLEYCIPGDTSYCAAPVAEWKMDEGVGTSIVDTSGNNKSLTTYNNPLWKQGKVGKSLSFNGTDEYTTSGEDLLTSSPMTICTWFKLNDTSQDSAIIGNFANSYWTNYGKGFKYTNGTLHLMCENNNDKETISTPLNDTNWHYACGIIRTSSGKLYLDGIEVASGDLNSDGYNYWTDIGAATYRGTQNLRNFNGLIDQTRIYNYARTPAQIAYDYNKGAPVAWYKFDECQGSTAYDWSGNQNNGTITIGSSGSQNSLGTCAVGTSAAWTNGSTGKINSSLNFDGTNDYVSVANNNLFNFGNNNFTISLWAKKTTNSYQTYGPLISKGLFSNAGEWNLYEYTNNNHWNFYADGSKRFEFNADIGQKWGNIIIGRKSDQMFVYFNGQETNSTSDSISGNNINFTNTKNFTIGTRDNGSTYFFNGQIDDVRIYNYALTSEQVKQIYNGGSVNFN